MTTIRGITISPPLVNMSCAWASDEDQLNALFDSPYTGAVITRTVTLGGFDENDTHTVAFLKDSLSSLNSYGYSPHPLFSYIGPGGWIRSILKRSPSSQKPIIVSITDTHPADLRLTLNSIQGLRAANESWATRIGIELNASCPNIPSHPPPAYELRATTDRDSDRGSITTGTTSAVGGGDELRALLDILADFFWNDKSLAIGIKLPPYISIAHISDVVQAIGTYSRVDRDSGRSMNPFAFFTCTNTLGNSLVYADQVEGERAGAEAGGFAIPPGHGGLAGEAIHPLSLGNVYAFSKLLAESEDPALREIVIIGAGGVTSPEAVARMHRAGAKVVGCATLLGKMGVQAFEHLSGKSSNTL